MLKIIIYFLISILIGFLFTNAIPRPTETPITFLQEYFSTPLYSVTKNEYRSLLHELYSEAEFGNSGIEYLGEGINSIVFGRNNTVIKVVQQGQNISSLLEWGQNRISSNLNGMDLGHGPIKILPLTHYRDGILIQEKAVGVEFKNLSPLAQITAYKEVNEICDKASKVIDSVLMLNGEFTSGAIAVTKNVYSIYNPEFDKVLISKFLFFVDNLNAGNFRFDQNGHVKVAFDLFAADFAIVTNGPLILSDEHDAPLKVIMDVDPSLITKTPNSPIKLLGQQITDIAPVSEIINQHNVLSNSPFGSEESMISKYEVDMAEFLIESRSSPGQTVLWLDGNTSESSNHHTIGSHLSVLDSIKDKSILLSNPDWPVSDGKGGRTWPNNFKNELLSSLVATLKFSARAQNASNIILNEANNFNPQNWKNLNSSSNYYTKKIWGMEFNSYGVFINDPKNSIIVEVPLAQLTKEATNLQIENALRTTANQISSYALFADQTVKTSIKLASEKGLFTIQDNNVLQVEAKNSKLKEGVNLSSILDKNGFFDPTKFSNIEIQNYLQTLANKKDITPISSPEKHLHEIIEREVLGPFEVQSTPNGNHAISTNIHRAGIESVSVSDANSSHGAYEFVKSTGKIDLSAAVASSIANLGSATEQLKLAKTEAERNQIINNVVTSGKDSLIFAGLFTVGAAGLTTLVIAVSGAPAGTLAGGVILIFALQMTIDQLTDPKFLQGAALALKNPFGSLAVGWKALQIVFKATWTKFDQLTKINWMRISIRDTLLAMKNTNNIDWVAVANEVALKNDPLSLGQKEFQQIKLLGASSSNFSNYPVNNGRGDSSPPSTSWSVPSAPLVTESMAYESTSVLPGAPPILIIPSVTPAGSVPLVSIPGLTGEINNSVYTPNGWSYTGSATSNREELSGIMRLSSFFPYKVLARDSNGNTTLIEWPDGQKYTDKQNFGLNLNLPPKDNGNFATRVDGKSFAMDIRLTPPSSANSYNVLIYNSGSIEQKKGSLSGYNATIVDSGGVGNKSKQVELPPQNGNPKEISDSGVKAVADPGPKTGTGAVPLEMPTPIHGLELNESYPSNRGIITSAAQGNP